MQASDFNEIYALYFQDVYKFLLALCHNEEIAEELTQDTFFKAMKSYGSFRGDCKVSTWLCQIAKHLWFQHLRKRKREISPEELPEPPGPSAEEDLLERERQLALLRQIHGLPEPQREVVYLRAFGGLSFREIGDVLGKTETWARVTFYRSKEKLRNGGGKNEK